MEHHLITCEKDIIELQEIYGSDAIFEIFETGEDTTLENMRYNMRYNADWNNFDLVTIQHI